MPDIVYTDPSISNPSANLPNETTGAIQLATIRDHVTQIQLASDILMEASKAGTLDTDIIVKRYTTDRLRFRITSLGTMTAYRNVAELASVDPKHADYTSDDIALQKDRVKLYISDEALLDAVTSNPLEDQKQQAAAGLAYLMDQRIHGAMVSNPYRVTYTKGANFFATVLPQVMEYLSPYTVSAVAMSYSSLARFWGLINDGYAGYANFASTPRFPYLDCPITLSTVIPDDQMFFVAGAARPIGVVTGDMKVRVWDDNDHGAIYWQMDIWRNAFEGVLKTGAAGSETNKGIVRVDLPANDTSVPDLIDGGDQEFGNANAAYRNVNVRRVYDPKSRMPVNEIALSI